jgi:hypothetical protein
MMVKSKEGKGENVASGKYDGTSLRNKYPDVPNQNMEDLSAWRLA